MTAKIQGGRSAALGLLDAVRDDDWIDLQGSHAGGAAGSWLPLQLGPIDNPRIEMRSNPEGRTPGP